MGLFFEKVKAVVIRAEKLRDNSTIVAETQEKEESKIEDAEFTEAGNKKTREREPTQREFACGRTSRRLEYWLMLTNL